MGYVPVISGNYSSTERIIGPWSMAFVGVEMSEEGLRKHYQQYGFEVLKIEHIPLLQQLHVDVRRPDHPQVMKFGFHVGHHFEFGNHGACRHEFKEYHGFTESYRYCTKCDHKESV